ncbi:hypothetical protein CAEBREN_13175 [Caenorhabditis brenneri]|uniref:Protein kinase domain-containing protein n=1 Tax=Caenorhabditis brenneri TaxID=135651 RepID=G0NI49_CAEBE|nr:hypothetical protein CAEBREN_13175 [Caenorhabditis brenneri]
MIDFFQLLFIAAAEFVRMLFTDLECVFYDETHYISVEKSVAVEEKKEIINKRSSARLSDSSHYNCVEKSVAVEAKKEVINRRTPARLSDFVKLKFLENGTFGEVYQVKNKLHGGIFALKEIHHPNNQVGERHLKDEIRVLLNLKSQFLYEMFHYFKTEAKVYYVFEYLTGGDLHAHLHRSGQLSEEDTRFYLAEVTLGLEFLHSHDVVHRDLKPENLMLDAQGHVKIIDLGSCKILRKGEKTNSLCGTRMYLAPEVVSRKLYDHAVDLWALGVAMFEFLTGRPLFAANTDAIIDQKILSGKKLPRSRFISANAYSLMEKLLKLCPLQRATLPDVKQSAFFQTTNWEKVKSRHYTAPYIPRTSDECDASHFDDFFAHNQLFRLPQKTVFEEMETHLFHDFDFETNPKSQSICVKNAPGRDFRM